MEVDTSVYDSVIGNTQKRQAADWYKPLLKQYQSYKDQRLAIEKEFNDDIASLRKSREQTEKAGNTNEVSKIDRSIAEAISNKGKALIQYDSSCSSRELSVSEEVFFKSSKARIYSGDCFSTSKSY